MHTNIEPYFAFGPEANINLLSAITGLEPSRLRAIGTPAIAPNMQVTSISQLYVPTQGIPELGNRSLYDVIADAWGNQQRIIRLHPRSGVSATGLLLPFQPEHIRSLDNWNLAEFGFTAEERIWVQPCDPDSPLGMDLRIATTFNPSWNNISGAPYMEYPGTIEFDIPQSAIDAAVASRSGS